MTEAWLPVSGYEGRYEVSDLGRIRSLERRDSFGRHVRERILSTTPDKQGRLYVVLCCGDGRPRRFAVHRIVLTAFRGPCPPGQEACHSPDPCPSNNRLSNLRWDTHYENCEDQRRHGTKPLGDSHRSSVLTSERVRKATALRRQGMKLVDIANEFGVSKQVISRALSGELWAHLGCSLSAEERFEIKRRNHSAAAKKRRRNSKQEFVR